MPSEEGLAGRRVVVVGASAGIGRAVAMSAVKAGASVVVAARRAEALADAIADADADGGRGTAVVADVALADDCARLAADTKAALGEVDLVVFAAGVAPLRRIEDHSAEDWSATIAVNTIGFNLVVAALRPLLAPGAIVAALSSETAAHPRYGLAAYNASKAALDMSVRSWRVEHPAIRFTRVTVGSTVGTAFGDGFDPELLGAAYRIWTRQGLTQRTFMTPEELASLLLGVLATALAHPGVGLEDLTLRPPPDPFPTGG